MKRYRSNNVEEGISPANIGGMGPIQLPTDTEPGSGDVPRGTKSEDDEDDEKEKVKEMKDFIPSFEKFISEARNFNDPLLIKMRAAQMKADQKASKSGAAKRELSPAKAKKLAKLQDQRAELMRDMEQEAEMEGGPIADRYGKELEKIDKQIAKLTGKKEKGFKLIESEEPIFEMDSEGIQSLADELNAEVYIATLKGGAKSVTIEATTTTKTWPDGAPVLKYLARGKAKKMSFDFYYRPFKVLHDVAHDWFYFTDGRKWYGLHGDEGYYEPEDLPFDMKIAESIDEANRSEIHKAAKKGSYPVTIVITNKGGRFDGEVAHQETVDTPAAVPAAMKVLYKKYATWAHTFAIEDAKGKILFQEGLETEVSDWKDFLNESEDVNEARSIRKIQNDYDKVVQNLLDTKESWKDCKASGDAKGEAKCLAELKELTTKKKALISELDDAIGLKDVSAQLAESLNERRSWGTFGTPEAKKVIKDMDKTWDKFSKTVSKAHADFRKEVKSIINSEDGSKSGITDSEGGSYITGMVNNFARKEFMMDDLGDISRYKYMIDLYESNDNE